MSIVYKILIICVTYLVFGSILSFLTIILGLIKDCKRIKLLNFSYLFWVLQRDGKTDKFKLHTRKFKLLADAKLTTNDFVDLANGKVSQHEQEENRKKVMSRIVINRVLAIFDTIFVSGLLILPFYFMMKNTPIGSISHETYGCICLGILLFTLCMLLIGFMGFFHSKFEKILYIEQQKFVNATSANEIELLPIGTYEVRYSMSIMEQQKYQMLRFLWAAGKKDYDLMEELAEWMEYCVEDTSKNKFTYACLYEYYAMFQPNAEKAKLYYGKMKINKKIDEDAQGYLSEAYYAYLVDNDSVKAREFITKTLDKVEEIGLLTKIEKDIIRDRAQVLNMHLNEMGS